MLVPEVRSFTGDKTGEEVGLVDMSAIAKSYPRGAVVR